MSDTPRTDKAYFTSCSTMYDLAGEMKLVEREHSTDGGVTWKPCGVVEESK